MFNTVDWQLQRKKTLLQEYKQRGKVNAFLDHRFGEQDEALAEEDKAILRFQKERMVCAFAVSLYWTYICSPYRITLLQEIAVEIESTSMLSRIVVKFFQLWPQNCLSNTHCH
jgi:hypothetical protein